VRVTVPDTYHYDLAILVPDKNMEAAVKGILTRPQALGIDPIDFRVYIHIGRDPGCYRHGHEFLRPMAGSHRHALIMLDRMGCGQDAMERRDIENEIENNLVRSGWEDRAAAIVIDPELEAWVWSRSPAVAACLGWASGSSEMRRWLAGKGLWAEHALKPTDPKLAVEQVMYHVRKRRSSAVYEQLGQKISFQRCMDPAFQKFKKTLQKWFGR